jgi:hypothetical protein
MAEKQPINTGALRSVNGMETKQMMVHSGHVETEGDLLYYHEAQPAAAASESFEP